MPREITIIDRGRGPQLSTSRITVQDLLPYFQEGCSDEEIMRWIPAVTPQEIAVIKCYFEANRTEVLELERLIEERNANRRNAPEVEKIREGSRAKFMALKEKLLKTKAKGDGT